MDCRRLLRYSVSAIVFKGLDVLLRISVSMTVTLACFVLELVLNSLAKPHYICRFAFWLDLAASWPGVLSSGGLEDQILKSSKPKKGRTCHYFCMPTTKSLNKASKLVAVCSFWISMNYKLLLNSSRFLAEFGQFLVDFGRGFLYTNRFG